MEILVLVEDSHGVVHRLSKEAISGAQAISNDVSEPENAIALNILFVVHLPSDTRNIFSLG